MRKITHTQKIGHSQVDVPIEIFLQHQFEANTMNSAALRDQYRTLHVPLPPPLWTLRAIVWRSSLSNIARWPIHVLAATYGQRGTFLELDTDLHWIDTKKFYLQH
jgi:hypothetical protein